MKTTEVCIALNRTEARVLLALLARARPYNAEQLDFMRGLVARVPIDLQPAGLFASLYETKESTND